MKFSILRNITLQISIGLVLISITTSISSFSKNYEKSNSLTVLLIISFFKIIIIF